MKLESWFLSMVASATTATSATSAYRYAMYFDQYHTTDIPGHDVTAGITHVITGFANSSIFVDGTNYTSFKPISDIRALFDNGTKVCMSIGGWGDIDGFGKGAATDASRKAYAKNIAATLDKLGYDCVDVDWEYPAGNSAFYRQIPNSQLASQIESFPLLLKEIKAAIGTKELSIAVPGLEWDMIAYTSATVPTISATVDFVNVMTYDLMNRRHNITDHHTDVKKSMSAVKTYIQNGMDPAKMLLGFAFYAKWFTVNDTACTTGLGCKTALLEAADGSDTAKSGAVTLEVANFATVDTSSLTSSTTTCGAGTTFKCASPYCCSQYGFCGSTAAHCGTGCQTKYGNCSDPNAFSLLDSFQRAVGADAKYDAAAGGAYAYDANNSIFWTFETKENIARKFAEIIAPLKMGGAMAYSLAEGAGPNKDFALEVAIRDGFKNMTKAARSC